MTAKIFRYEIPVDDKRHQVRLTDNPLGVDCRRYDVVEFWAIHEDGNPGLLRTFTIVGTGHNLPDDWVKVWGHAITANGQLVWHLVEVADLY